MSEYERSPELQRQGFMRLPSELQLAILRLVFEPDQPDLIYQSDFSRDWEELQSLKEQLKPARLISRVFHDAITPIIFASIHLHASDLSFQRAEAIANSDLAHLVREIVHHEGTFAGAREDKALFHSVLKSHRRRQDYPKDYALSADDEQLYTNYLNEIAAGRRSQSFETHRIISLLQKLPRCITFTTLPYSKGWGDPLSSAYTLRRTGLKYLPNPTGLGPITEPSFLSCMARWSPRVLNLANFTPESHLRLLQLLWENGHQSVDPANCAEKLIYLRLNWPDHPSLRDTQQEYPRLLTYLFQSAQNLVHLEITHGFYLNAYRSILPPTGLPKLTRLTISRGLHAGIWAEPHLCDVIKQLGPTLKHLHFEDIRVLIFYSPAATEPPNGSGSMLRLLFNISSSTNLESCTGLETVRDAKIDGPMRKNFVMSGPKPGKAAILMKVEEAVCGRRPWPEGFDMGYLPVDRLSQNLSMDIRNNVEAAFIFSTWEDTVDPWDTERILEVKDDGDDYDDDEIENIETPMRELAVVQPDNPGESSSQNIQQGPAGTKSRFKRISKMLGLK